MRERGENHTHGVDHVAIIMDGNGRWAERQSLPRVAGHQAGAETVRRIVRHACRRSVPYITLYAFSTENWNRPQPEVDALMELFGHFLQSETPSMIENGIALRVIGDLAGLSPSLRQRIEETVRATSSGAAITMTLAINYGGRDEIVRAVRAVLIDQVRTGGKEPVNTEDFARYLDTAGMPDPDLIIRTAGELRMSNFLPWQGAYAELYFTEKSWPEFDEDDFDAALSDYTERVRKFGGTVPAESTDVRK